VQKTLYGMWESFAGQAHPIRFCVIVVVVVIVHDILEFAHISSRSSTYLLIWLFFIVPAAV
jgi:hypothetical protein